MSRFNNYFMNDFASCKLIAYARDPHRGRNVRLYLMPGHIDVVGVTDGIDKWIAPVIANPFSVDIIKWMKNHLDGVPNPPPVAPSSSGSRRRLTLAADPDQPPTRARRAFVASIESTPTPRSRRAVLANI